jgi:regulator of replication initiation timing
MTDMTDEQRAVEELKAQLFDAREECRILRLENMNLRDENRELRRVIHIPQGAVRVPILGQLP